MRSVHPLGKTHSFVFSCICSSTNDGVGGGDRKPQRSLFKSDTCAPTTTFATGNLIPVVWAN